MSASDYQAMVSSEVYSSDGSNVGHVSEIVDQDGTAVFLQVKDNGLFGIGAESFLVPVDAIASTEEGKVTVNRTAEDLVGIPAHDGHEPKSPSYFESLYAWWWRADAN
ncbi:MAG: PRC-barrel domain-containing protein [Thermomicrobiales bacterium]|nr:PRC-barrel domain-containing protein [Thermomicrobiales bacterium]MCO5220781.1 PRC-barrel domain-containing protein [Thermomicrobiales bacterium]